MHAYDCHQNVTLQGVVAVQVTNAIFKIPLQCYMHS